MYVLAVFMHMGGRRRSACCGRGPVSLGQPTSAGASTRSTETHVITAVAADWPVEVAAP